MKATVGRIVHFYDRNKSADANNNIGQGPYAAIVSQVFSPSCANLLIVGYAGVVWGESSVLEQTEGATKYWCWPPRE